MPVSFSVDLLLWQLFSFYGREFQSSYLLQVGSPETSSKQTLIFDQTTLLSPFDQTNKQAESETVDRIYYINPFACIISCAINVKGRSNSKNLSKINKEISL